MVRGIRDKAKRRGKRWTQQRHNKKIKKSHLLWRNSSRNERFVTQFKHSKICYRSRNVELMWELSPDILNNDETCVLNKHRDLHGEVATMMAETRLWYLSEKLLQRRGHVARVLVVWWVIDGACVGFLGSSMFGRWGDGGRRIDRRSTMLGGGFRRLISRHRRDRGNDVGRWRRYATVVHGWRRWVVHGDGGRLGCGWCTLLIVVDARLGFIGEVVVGLVHEEDERVVMMVINRSQLSENQIIFCSGLFFLMNGERRVVKIRETLVITLITLVLFLLYFFIRWR